MSLKMNFKLSGRYSLLHYEWLIQIYEMKTWLKDNLLPLSVISDSLELILRWPNSPSWDDEGRRSSPTNFEQVESRNIVFLISIYKY